MLHSVLSLTATHAEIVQSGLLTSHVLTVMYFSPTALTVGLVVTPVLTARM